MSDLECPVRKCGKPKERWHLTCLNHWQQIPIDEQKMIFKLYKNRPGSEEHRELCFRILRRLNVEVMREEEASEA